MSTYVKTWKGSDIKRKEFFLIYEEKRHCLVTYEEAWSLLMCFSFLKGLSHGMDFAFDDMHGQF